MRNRNGSSLIASPAVIVRPKGSPITRTSGGRSKPVAQGESTRMAKPEGAARKASPKAAAAWGTASTGESARRNTAKA